MTRSLILVSLMTLYTINSFSQLSKGKFTVEFAGNYIESLDNIHTVAADLNGRTNFLDINLSMGYCLSNSVIWGIGLNYGHIKNINESYVLSKNYFYIEEIETKNTIIAPLMYFKYYKQLMNKLYINLNLCSSYGFVNSEISSFSAMSYSYASQNNSAQINLSNNLNNDNKKDSYYLSCSLQPEIEYFITNRLGIKIQLGGARYNNYDGKEHDWRVSFNPSYWSYGLSFSLGKGFISQ